MVLSTSIFSNTTTRERHFVIIHIAPSNQAKTRSLKFNPINSATVQSSSCSNAVWSSILRLQRQVKGVMGTCPAAYRFAHPADNRKFVGIYARWDGRQRWSKGKSDLEGAAALTTATHLSSADEEREHRRSWLSRGKASFGENIPG